MKKQATFFTAIALVALFGCDQPSNSSVTTATPRADTLRPKNEMVLVNKLWDAETKLNTQANDVGKQAIADSARTDVSKYLTTTLNAKFDNWIAYVYQIHVNGNSVNIYLIIPQYWEMGTDHPSQSAVNLYAEFNSADSKNKAIVDMIKSVAEGDRVTVSGEFEKLANKVDDDVTFLGLHMGQPDDVLTMPNYNVTITNIKKHK